MENKYKQGEIVWESTRPKSKLIVSRYDRGLYYCKTQENLSRKELVYFERDLRASTQER